MKDMEDGSYMVRYTAPAPGEYIIECEFKGTFGGQEGGVRGGRGACVDNLDCMHGGSVRGERGGCGDLKSARQNDASRLGRIQNDLVKAGIFHPYCKFTRVRLSHQ